MNDELGPEDVTKRFSEIEFLNLQLIKYKNGQITAEQIVKDNSPMMLVHTIINLSVFKMDLYRTICKLRKHLTFASRANASKRRHLVSLHVKYQEAMEAPFTTWWIRKIFKSNWRNKR